MRWLLAFATLAACAADPGQSTELQSLTCANQMRVGGPAPYSVQCAAGYAVTDTGVQLAFTATDSSGATWMSARAATPRTPDESDGSVVFPLQAAGAPAMGTLTLTAHLVDASGVVLSSDLTETVLVSP
jgi:hypothetical protein